MNFFKDFFSSNHALVLLYDFLNSEGLEEWKSQIKEVGRFYRWVSLEELVCRVKEKKKLGVAALCFKYPRRAVMDIFIKEALTFDIPCHVFLDPDSLGTSDLNLPVEKIHPLSVMAGWGKIFSYSSECVSYGLHIQKEWEQSIVLEKLTYFKERAERPFRFVYCKQAYSSIFLKEQGIQAQWVDTVGKIGYDSSLMNLTHWKL